MKKISTTLMALLFITLFFSNNAIAAEDDPVIIPVPEQYEGSYDGVINRFIYGDTTDTGERKHTNPIYQLTRAAYYDLNVTMTVKFNMTIAAAPDDQGTTDDDAPPMISRGITNQGAYITRMFSLSGDSTNMTLKGVILNGMRSNYDTGNPVVSEGASLLSVSNNYHRVVFDSCIIHGFPGTVLANRSSANSTFIFTNNKFRNNLHLDNPFAGRIIANTSKTVHQDTIKFINNTFLMQSNHILLDWEFIDYLEFDHNTLFVMSTNALWIDPIPYGKFTNNIFFNYQTVGETDFETLNGFWDLGKVAGVTRSSICKFDLALPEVLMDNGMTEEDRTIDFSNNVYAWSEGLKTYWATHKDSSAHLEDSDWDYLDILPITFMNARTDSMFKSLGKYNYPHFKAENNLELDPGFDAQLVSDVMEKEMNWVKLYREYGRNGIQDAQERFYIHDDIYWEINWDWPLQEDLTYTNTDVFTHAEGGFPAGDLNWYPEKKADWEDAASAIGRDETSLTAPGKYVLSQNYPNPFNPTTEINFSIPMSGKTTLVVYNVLGQEVATVVNKDLSAGAYKYKFDASNLSSGLYFYKLQSKNYSAIKKMMLLK